MRAARTALTGLSQRQEAISSNVANIDTVGYQRREVSFEGALRDSLASAGGERTRLAVTHEGHLTGAAAPGGSAAGAGGAVTPRDVIAARNDNNAVSIDEEMVLLAETEIRYQALTQTLGRRLATLRNVIRG